MSTLNEQQVAARGRELEQARWELPQRYRIQAELLALPPDKLKKRDPEMYRLWQRSQEQQEIWRRQANEPFSRPTAQDMFRAQAVQMAQELYAVIARLKEEAGKSLTGTGEANIEELQAAIHALRLRRAEALAITGRFDLAAEETPDPERREGYLRIFEALLRPDDEPLCECEPHRGRGKYAKLEVSKTYVRKEIWSIVHGQPVFLLACSGCPALNAVPELPQHISEGRAHRARALQLARNLNPEEAKSLLSAQKHTSAHLLQK